MKRVVSYLAGLCLSVVCLTSCMEGSNVWEGVVFGVLDMSTKTFQPIIKTSSGDLYAHNLETIISNSHGDVKLGDCMALYIRIDSDIPENSPSAVAASGYQTVTILQYGTIPKYGMNYSFTDTTTVLPNEVPVIKGHNNFAD